MRKCVFAAVFVMLVIFSVSGQSRNSSAVRAPAGMAGANGQFYEVLSDAGAADAQLLARELDARFLLYNRIFHFDSKELNGRLKVRSYRDKSAYDSYVSERLDRSHPGAVYLHYNQADRRELIINRGSAEEDVMFPHQVFVQYLRAFVPHPPAWIREGFAIYFSTVKFDPGKSNSRDAVSDAGLIYEENLSWLEVVKSLGNKAPSAESVLLADVRGGNLPDNFQGVAWALVSLMKDSGKSDYFRILYESFLLLDKEASADVNAQVAYNHIKRWVEMSSLDRDYKTYLNSRKTFAELITEGQVAYTVKELKLAEASFQAAQKQRPNHYAAYYYLGLIAYELRNFKQAEEYYNFALRYGADPALVSYALGINAAAAGRSSDAISFLEQAKSSSPDQYGEQADTIIRRLR